MYKAVFNGEYLCHYNKNHSPKNGQFVSGDGDGDGKTNDHADRYTDSKGKTYSRKYVNPDGSLTKLGQASADRMVRFGNDYGKVHQTIEDMSTILTRNVKPGNKILVDSETKAAFAKALKNYELAKKFAKDNFDTPISSIVKMDDGNKYIYTSLTDKLTGMSYERFNYLTAQDTKSPYIDYSIDGQKGWTK